MAAVLAAGPGAVLSHQSAAALWDIRKSATSRIEVTSPKRCRRPGLRVHNANLPPDEVTTHDGIPVTTPSRTALDLTPTLTRQRLHRVLSELERLHLPDPIALQTLLTRHPRSRGSKSLRQTLAAFEPTHTRSELEDRFLTFLDATHLPTPEVNANVDLGDRWISPDFLWRDRRLIVELDGRDTHGIRAAFEGDRARDRAAQVAGYRVVRITWRQLHDEPAAIAADRYRLHAL